MSSSESGPTEGLLDDNRAEGDSTFVAEEKKVEPAVVEHRKSELDSHFPLDHSTSSQSKDDNDSEKEKNGDDIGLVYKLAAEKKAEEERFAKIEAERLVAEKKVEEERLAKIEADKSAEQERFAKIEADKLAAAKEAEEERLRLGEKEVVKSATPAFGSQTPLPVYSDGNLNSALIFPVNLGQSWTFEAEYSLTLTNGFNTIFSYGRYTEGVLIRSLRGDDIYVQGQNLGSLDVFDGPSSNGEFVPVKIEFNSPCCEGKMRIYSRSRLIKEVEVAMDLNVTDFPSILIGSAHHAAGEGFEGSVRNIKYEKIEEKRDETAEHEPATVEIAPVSSSALAIEGEVADGGEGLTSSVDMKVGEFSNNLSYLLSSLSSEAIVTSVTPTIVAHTSEDVVVEPKEVNVSTSSERTTEVLPEPTSSSSVEVLEVLEVFTKSDCRLGGNAQKCIDDEDDDDLAKTFICNLTALHLSVDVKTDYSIAKAYVDSIIDSIMEKYRDKVAKNSCSSNSSNIISNSGDDSNSAKCNFDLAQKFVYSLLDGVVASFVARHTTAYLKNDDDAAEIALDRLSSDITIAIVTDALNELLTESAISGALEELSSDHLSITISDSVKELESDNNSTVSHSFRELNSDSQSIVRYVETPEEDVLDPTLESRENNGALASNTAITLARTGGEEGSTTRADKAQVDDAKLTPREIKEVVMYFKSCCRDETTNEITLLELEAALRRHRHAKVNEAQETICRELMGRLDSLLTEHNLSVEAWFHFSDTKGAGLTKASSGGIGDNKVSHLELIDSLSRLCQQSNQPTWDKEDVLQLLRYMDPSGDSDVTLLEAELAFRRFKAPPEYLQVLQSATPLVSKLEAYMASKLVRVVDLFRRIDADDSNRISVEELQMAVEKILDSKDSVAFVDEDEDIAEGVKFKPRFPHKDSLLLKKGQSLLTSKSLTSLKDSRDRLPRQNEMSSSLRENSGDGYIKDVSLISTLPTRSGQVIGRAKTAASPGKRSGSPSAITTSGATVAQEFTTMYSELVSNICKSPSVLSILVSNKNDLSTVKVANSKSFDPLSLLKQDFGGLPLQRFPSQVLVKFYEIATSFQSTVFINLREWTLYLYELKDTYGEDVLKYYQPGCVQWWIQNMKDIIYIVEKASGEFTLGISKKNILKTIRRKFQESKIFDPHESVETVHKLLATKLPPLTPADILTAKVKSVSFTPTHAHKTPSPSKKQGRGEKKDTGKSAEKDKYREKGNSTQMTPREIKEVVMYFKSCCRDETTNEITLLELEAALRRHRHAKVNEAQETICRELMGRLDSLLTEHNLSVEAWFHFSDTKGAGLTKASSGGIGDNKVSHLELIDSLSRLCQQSNQPTWDKEDVLQLLRYMDPSGDSDVTLLEAELAFRRFKAPPEYLQVLQSATPLVSKLEAYMASKLVRVVDLFRRIDADDSNRISVEELQMAVEKMLDVNLHGKDYFEMSRNSDDAKDKDKDKDYKMISPGKIKPKSATSGLKKKKPVDKPGTRSNNVVGGGGGSGASLPSSPNASIEINPSVLSQSMPLPSLDGSALYNNCEASESEFGTFSLENAINAPSRKVFASWSVVTDWPVSNAMVNWKDKYNNILFQFNTRREEGDLVMNSCEVLERTNFEKFENVELFEIWGDEERVSLPSSAYSSRIKAIVTATNVGYEVYFDNLLVHIYPHRFPLVNEVDVFPMLMYPYPPNWIVTELVVIDKSKEGSRPSSREGSPKKRKNFRKIWNPLDEEKIGLREVRPEERIAREAIIRARKSSSGSFKFHNRKLTRMEKRFFNSPYAAKPSDILNDIEIDSEEYKMKKVLIEMGH
jgi:hypothetical protein